MGAFSERLEKGEEQKNKEKNLPTPCYEVPLRRGEVENVEEKQPENSSPYRRTGKVQR